jgi:hypothetical protein
VPIWVDGKGFVGTVLENRELLGANEKVRITRPKEMRILYGDIFANCGA